MKLKYINKGLVVLFIIIACVFLVTANLNKPRVFILHSYDLDYSWVADINKGFDRILKNQAYSIRYHYMDTKRHNDPKFMEKAGVTATALIESWEPDVLIVVDDNAQKYTAMNFIDTPKKLKIVRFENKILNKISDQKSKDFILTLYSKDGKSNFYILKNNLTSDEQSKLTDILKSVQYNSHIKIIYTGVNAEAKKYGYDKARNVTGILERIPFKDFIKIFQDILPEDKRKIVHISDNSPTSVAIHEELEKITKTITWKPFELVKSFRTNDFDQWKKNVKNVKSVGDILLVTHYHTIKDKTGNKVSPAEVMKWTVANIDIPYIGCWGFFVEHGGMMAVAVSPFEQGEEAAKIAVDIIDKKVPKQIKTIDFEKDILAKLSEDKKKFILSVFHKANNYRLKANLTNIQRSQIADILTSVEYKLSKWYPGKTSELYVMYINDSGIKKFDIKLPLMLEAFAKATNTYFK